MGILLCSCITPLFPCFSLLSATPITKLVLSYFSELFHFFIKSLQSQREHLKMCNKPYSGGTQKVLLMVQRLWGQSQPSLMFIHWHGAPFSRPKQRTSSFSLPKDMQSASPSKGYHASSSETYVGTPLFKFSSAAKFHIRVIPLK